MVDLELGVDGEDRMAYGELLWSTYITCLDKFLEKFLRLGQPKPPS